MKISIKIFSAYSLVLFTLLSTGNLLKAQNTKEGTENSLHTLELGLRFMPTISSFETRTSDGSIVEGESVIGYGIGGMLGINFTKNVGIQAEVIYNSVSQKFKDQALERKITVDYINVPLLLSLNTDKTVPVNLNLVVGPQVGLNVGSDFETSSGAEPDTLQAVLAVKQGDLGFAYGAGIELALNESHTIRLDVGFRGVYGLIDISDKSQTTVSNSYYLLDRTNMKTYSAYIGLTFAL